MMTNFKPALINAVEMYRHICQYSDFIEANPIQFVPVKELLEWVNSEHRQEPCIFLYEESCKTAICFIVNSSSMIDTIDQIMKQERESIAYQVPSMADLLNYRFCTTVSGKRLINLYKHALLIADELQIALPVIHIVEQEQIPGDRAERFTELDENDVGIADLIMIRHAGALDMIHSLAHELRHCWQEYKAEEYYRNYIPSGYTTYEDFNSQKEEIDAEAYACCYINSLGFNGMSFTFNKDEHSKLYQAIKKRMNEI